MGLPPVHSCSLFIDLTILLKAEHLFTLLIQSTNLSASQFRVVNAELESRIVVSRL